MRFDVFPIKIDVEKFNSMIEKILERFEKDDYHSWDFINRLSENGWVPPISFDCYEYFQCSSNELSDEEFEQGLMDFFEENLENVFLEIINLEEYHNPFIHKMLQEVVQAYKQELYQICIPSLFAILERYLADLSNDGDLNKVRYGAGLGKKIWVETDHSDKYIETCQEIPGRFIHSCYLIKSFIDKYFTSINFEDFDSLNRHAFAHGRQRYFGTRLDTIKLIFIITNIINMYHEIEFITVEVKN
ncbi:hypothetical protein FHC58_07100 [Enterobacter hormaechei]|uniref:hypothetical protein n=1 Tax=Enterobacter hormaechei TaxID=158836 RepID=UPI001C70305D|nr:hypothetical protein [Enterobacter hormaechei]MBW9412718.1 hypothetical protein [Enterobacter hormaechei]